MSRRLVMIAVLSLALAATAAAGGKAPAWYVKQDTWQATMRASRTALARQRAKEEDTPFQPFVSPVLRGRAEPLRVSVDVSGLDELWLVATYGPDDYHHDRAVWGEPVVIDKQGKATPLVKMKRLHAKVGWGKLLVNQKLSGGKLRVGKRTFEHGFWAHAPSSLAFRLEGQYERFEAWVGIGVGAPEQGSCVFKVLDKGGRSTETEELWRLVKRDFPDAQSQRQMAWEREDGIWAGELQPGNLKELAGRYAKASHRVESLAEQAGIIAPKTADPAVLEQVRGLYYRSRQVAAALAKAKTIETEPLRRAIQDLTTTFGEEYPKGEDYLKRLDALEAALVKATGQKSSDSEAVASIAQKLLDLRREALLANPLLDFDRVLLVRRKPNRMGLPANWQSNSSVPKTGYDNQIAALDYKDADAALETVHQPDGGKFVGDVDLHFDADRVLFSSIGKNGAWRLHELRIDPKTGQPANDTLREIDNGDKPDVDHYDGCYLPDGDIMFCSTACFIGVPCVFGGSHVAVLYRMHPDGSGVRQLCFEQDHDWCPTVMNNGRVLYLRWEYTDTPHSNTRLLFHMNPDGTEQMEYYGSNSYWPNSFFYARPIPGHPTKVVGIATGHHGLRRMGQLVVLDPARGRREASGAVQAIPGHGEPVEPVIRDQLRNGKWPLFLHPYPLGDGDGRGSGKYFLVACQPQRGANWGLYLVDAFDNMLLLREEPGYALLEPVPLEPRPRPPVIPDKVRPGKKDAIIYLSDIYEGDGLKGIPRGTVKRLRIFSYHFSYRHMGGLLGVIGMDGPWDMRRILGTVPVEPDGSATFRVPANTPLSIQPLDGEGKALQVMRSWMTAMPGEVLSCAGCHEPQNTSPPNRDVMALSKPPADIEPWHGPERPYAFKREVQPVLDAHCVSCHDGKPRPDGQTLCDLRGEKIITDYRSVTPGTGGKRGGRFSVSYVNLHRFVRRPGIESDYHMLEPMEFHADTTQLVQMLEKGHHGVRLDAEAWDRLVTWIDLNAPYHGTWTEAGWDPKGQRQRRRELLKEYAGMDLDPEKVIPPEPYERPEAPAAKPAMATPKSKIENPEGWPFDAAEAKRRQAAAGAKAKRSIELGEGVQMDLVLVPPGEFVMGSAEGYADERPQGRVRIERPFWMGAMEVTNEQFARFDPSHDSRVEPKNTYQFGVHGYPANGPRQPVVRITWEQAMAFCRCLSERTGERVTLPTEAQWEWACRAGSADAFSFGSLEADYSKHANVADKTLREFASNPYTVSRPLKKATKYDDWIPRDDRFRDGGLIAMPAGTYAPNAWGLREMHGNVFEWTRSAYRPYPYSPDDGRNEPGAAGDRVVRGGSWRDRPVRCRAAFRLAHRRYQRVYNVGFRVIVQPVVKAVQRAAPMAGDHGSGS
jgi:formylglycine-generating enzyme required for sulfatase activity